MQKQGRQFAHYIQQIFPSCKGPIKLHEEQIINELTEQKKGEKKDVKQGLLPNSYEVHTLYDNNYLLGCDVLLGDVKIKGNKLSNIVGTRVLNIQGHIQEIINALSQV